MRAADNAGGLASAPSTRRRLLDAAYELLVEEGYHATTVQKLVRRLRLTSGALYAHFLSKDELLVEAVLHRWSRSPQAAPLRVSAGRREAARLEDLVALLVQQLSAPPEPEHRLLTEVTGAAIRDPRAEELLHAGAARVARFARAAVEQGKAEGLIDAAISTEGLVAVVVALYLGAITSKSLGLTQPDHDEVLGILGMFNLAPRS